MTRPDGPVLSRPPAGPPQGGPPGGPEPFPADLGTLYLGPDLRLRWFTPGAGAVFHLGAADVGRPLAEFAPRLGGPTLAEAAAQVLGSGAETEVRTLLPDGRDGLARLFVSAGRHRRVEGVVVTCRLVPGSADGDGLAADYRALVVEAPVPVLVHTLDGEILEMSRAVGRLTGYTRKDLPDGRAWLHLVLRLSGDVIEQMHANPASFFACGPTPPPTETTVWTRAGEPRTWLFQATPLRQLPDGRLYVAAMAIDVTERRRAEEALRRSEERLRMALHAAGAAAFEWDVSQGAITWSPEAFAMYGIDPASVPDPPRIPRDLWLSRLHPDDAPRFVQHIRDQMAHPTAEFRDEFRIRHPDRGERWLVSLGRFEQDAHGAPVRLLGINLDITQRRQVEEACRQSEERLRLALAGGELGIWELDTATGLAHLDAQERRFFGLDPVGPALPLAELLTRVHPDDRAAVARVEEQVRTTGQFRLDFRVLLPDGRTRWLAGRGGPMTPEPGRLPRVLGVNYDITPLKEAESALRASEEQARHQLAQLETLYATTPVGLAFLDTRLRYVRVNNLLAEINGRSAETHRGLSLQKVLGRLGKRLAPVFRQVLQTGRPLLGVEVHGRPPRPPAEASPPDASSPDAGSPDAGSPDGSSPDGEDAPGRPGGQRDWLVNVHPVQGPDGRPFGLTVTVQDITARKEMERSLRQLNERLEHLVAERTASLRASEEQVRTILATAAEGIVTLDARGHVLSLNQATERMFGYTAAEVVGRHFQVLIPPPGRQGDSRAGAEARTGAVRRLLGGRRELIGRRKDGSFFPVEVAVSEVGPHGPYTSIIIDISRRRELEREVVEAAAAEQHRIGQELHDGVGQELTGLNLMLAGLVQRLEAAGRPDDARLAARIATLLRQTHQEVRALSRGIVPVEVDPEGLRTALEELVARTREQSGLSCTFTAAGPVAVTDTVTATHLYRIAQEAIANALRHAQARRIDVTLRATAHALTLSVRDDGVGPPPGLDEARGLGVRLMHYRAGVLGGTLTIEPAPGGGTLVTCALPRDAAI